MHFFTRRCSPVIRCRIFLQKKLVSCLPDQAEALTRSPKIKHITFIGSERVGRQVGPISRQTESWHVILMPIQIAIAATQHLTPVTLELGGKDPAIILPGTDVERWSSLWMRGILYVLCVLTRALYSVCEQSERRSKLYRHRAFARSQGPVRRGFRPYIGPCPWFANRRRIVRR